MRHDFSVWFHGLTVLLLSGLIATLVPFSAARLPYFLLFFSIMIAGAILMVRFLPGHHNSEPLSISVLDRVVFLSLWTSLNILSLNTVFPIKSVRNYPDLTRLYPLFFVIGLFILFVVLQKKRLSFLMKGWIILFMMTSFPYTRALDHHVVSLALPLMAVLYSLHRDMNRLAESIHISRMTPTLILITCVPFIRLSLSFHHQYSDAVPEILLGLTALATLILTIAAGQQEPLRTRFIVRTAVASHVFLLLILSIMRSIWTASSWGIWSVITFRLWISLLHPNAIAIYLASSIILLEFRQAKKHFNSIFRLCTISAGAMLLLTQSRNAVIVFCVMIVLILATGPYFNGSPHRKSIYLGAFFVFGTFVSVLMIWRVGYRLIDVGMISDRIDLWKACVDGIHHHPLLGHGPGEKAKLAQYATGTSSNSDEFLRLWLSWDRLGRHFHNVFLEWVWLFGLSGLITMIAGAITAWRGHNQRSVIWIYSFAVLLFTALVDCPFYYPALLVLITSITGFWLASSFPGKRPSTRGKLNQGKHQRLIWSLAIAAVYMVFLFPMTWKCYVIASGWNDSLPDESIHKFQLAAEGIYPSARAANRMVEIMLNQNVCVEAQIFLETYLRDTCHQTQDLLRILAWLTPDEAKRTCLLKTAWQKDPKGLLSDNLIAELMLSRYDSASENSVRWFQRSIFSDSHLVADLRKYGKKRNDGVWLDASGMKDFLSDRDLPLTDCELHYPGRLIAIEDHLTAIERNLSSNEEIDPRVLENDRRNFLNSAINSDDFIRATRLLNTWKLNLQDSLDGQDIDTFNSSGPSDYAIIQARKAVREHDFGRAGRYLESLRGSDSVSAEWFYLSGLVEASRNQWPEALASFDDAVEKSPNDVRFLVEKGVALYHNGRKLQALQLFSEVIKRSPWIVTARVYTGIILFESGRFEEALPHLEIVLQMVPYDPWSYFNLYKCLQSIPGKDTQSQEVLSKMRCMFPEQALPEEIRERIEEQHYVE